MIGGFGVRYDVSELAPLVNSFCHVKAPCRSSPCEYRLVTFACSESYQVSPSGGPRNGGMPPHCGNGRSACFSGWLAGNPGYTPGTVKIPLLFATRNCGNRACTRGSPTGKPSNSRSFALDTSIPTVWSPCGVRVL